jgi:hypothetical protein
LKINLPKKFPGLSISETVKNGVSLIPSPLEPASKIKPNPIILNSYLKIPQTYSKIPLTLAFSNKNYIPEEKSNMGASFFHPMDLLEINKTLVKICKNLKSDSIKEILFFLPITLSKIILELSVKDLLLNVSLTLKLIPKTLSIPVLDYLIHQMKLK